MSFIDPYSLDLDNILEYSDGQESPLNNVIMGLPTFAQSHAETTGILADDYDIVPAQITELECGFNPNSVHPLNNHSSDVGYSVISSPTHNQTLEEYKLTGHDDDTYTDCSTSLSPLSPSSIPANLAKASKKKGCQNNNTKGGLLSNPKKRNRTVDMNSNGGGSQGNEKNTINVQGKKCKQSGPILSSPPGNVNNSTIRQQPIVDEIVSNTRQSPLTPNAINNFYKSSRPSPEMKTNQDTTDNGTYKIQTPSRPPTSPLSQQFGSIIPLHRNSSPNIPIHRPLPVAQYHPGSNTVHIHQHVSLLCPMSVIRSRLVPLGNDNGNGSSQNNGRWPNQPFKLDSSTAIITPETSNSFLETLLQDNSNLIVMIQHNLKLGYFTENIDLMTKFRCNVVEMVRLCKRVLTVDNVYIPPLTIQISNLAGYHSTTTPSGQTASDSISSCFCSNNLNHNGTSQMTSGIDSAQLAS